MIFLPAKTALFQGIGTIHCGLQTILYGRRTSYLNPYYSNNLVLKLPHMLYLRIPLCNGQVHVLIAMLDLPLRATSSISASIEYVWQIEPFFYKINPTR